MRVLVAGSNAQKLAKVAGALANDLVIETAASKATALALLEGARFDLVLACERLSDGSGLDVLSHVAVNAPNIVRIFAARPSTLEVLEGELGPFGLFRTLPYPINFRTLWAAMDLVRRGHAPAQGAPPEAAARVPHVVLESDWEEVAAASSSEPLASTTEPVAPLPARIPESEAFKRARSRRNEERRRREPSVSNESLAQLARRAAAQGSIYGPRSVQGVGSVRGRGRRAALFVGSGVFAASVVTALMFFVLGTNNSVGRSRMVASIDSRPLPQKASTSWQTPWTPVTESNPPPTFVPDDPVVPAEAQAQAEAPPEAEASQNGADYPGPPPPNPPPGPSEPPLDDQSGNPLPE